MRASPQEQTGEVGVSEVTADLQRIGWGPVHLNARHDLGTDLFVQVRDVRRFPPVRQDLAFVLDAATPAVAVQAALLDAGGDLVETCLLFDVFSGPPLPQGKKSLAFSIDLRAQDRTLTDEEADAVVRRVAERLAAEFGAELRAG